jgi:hypothetical protein
LAKEKRGIEWEMNFIIGHLDGSNDNNDKKLMQESEQYGDILFVNMTDKYGALSKKVSISLPIWKFQIYKVFLWIKYAMENYDFEYIFKTDDDSFIRIDRLLESLNYMPKERVYFGVNKDAAMVIINSLIDWFIVSIGNAKDILCWWRGIFIIQRCCRIFVLQKLRHG